MLDLRSANPPTSHTRYPPGVASNAMSQGVSTSNHYVYSYNSRPPRRSSFQDWGDSDDQVASVLSIPSASSSQITSPASVVHPESQHQPQEPVVNDSSYLNTSSADTSNRSPLNDTALYIVPESDHVQAALNISSSSGAVTNSPPIQPASLADIAAAESSVIVPSLTYSQTHSPDSGTRSLSYQSRHLHEHFEAALVYEENERRSMSLEHLLTNSPPSAPIPIEEEEPDSPVSPSPPLPPPAFAVPVNQQPSQVVSPSLLVGSISPSDPSSAFYAPAVPPFKGRSPTSAVASPAVNKSAASIIRGFSLQLPPLQANTNHFAYSKPAAVLSAAPLFATALPPAPPVPFPEAARTSSIEQSPPTATTSHEMTSVGDGEFANNVQNQNYAEKQLTADVEPESVAPEPVNGISQDDTIHMTPVRKPSPSPDVAVAAVASTPNPSISSSNVSTSSPSPAAGVFTSPTLKQREAQETNFWQTVEKIALGLKQDVELTQLEQQKSSNNSSAASTLSNSSSGSFTFTAYVSSTLHQLIHLHYESEELEARILQCQSNMLTQGGDSTRKRHLLRQLVNEKLGNAAVAKSNQEQQLLEQLASVLAEEKQ